MCGGSWSFRACGGLPRGFPVLGDRRPFRRNSSVNQNWQQVETAADWISCSLPGLRRPFRGVRRVMVVPCLRRPASWYRCLATAGFLDGTELHGTPARRDIPRRPSNQTFVAVPKLKKKHISSTTVSTRLHVHSNSGREQNSAMYHIRGNAQWSSDQLHVRPERWL